MDPVTQAAIIQTGGSAANTTGDILSNAFFGRRNETWAREDATTAFDRQRQLLAEQQAYESPAAQMQRYIDAGLHPGLIYSQQQGSIAPPTVPQAATANVAPPSMSLDTGAFLQSELIRAQVERLRTQNQNDTDMTQGQLERWAKENDVSLAQAENYQAMTRQANVSNQKMYKEMSLLDQDILDKIYENAFKRETYDERVKATMAEYGMTQQKAERFERILESSIADSWASANLKSKQAWQIEQLTPEEVALKRSLSAFYDAQKNSAVTQNQILQLDRDLKAWYGDAEQSAAILEKLNSGGPINMFFKHVSTWTKDTRSARLESQNQ